MLRLLLVLCLPFSLLLAQEHSLLNQLDSTLEHIDALEEYGPPSTLKGLEQYLEVIADYSSKRSLTCEEAALVEGILERLFSRYAFRDGSQRSRIYAEAHRRVISLLDTTSTGKELLLRHARQNPLVEAYIEAFI